MGSQLGIHRKLGLSPLGTVHETVLGHLLKFREGNSTTPDPNTSEKVSRCKWEAYRDANFGGVYTIYCQEEGILLESIAIEMGGVSRYFSKVSGSGVDVTLLTNFGGNSYGPIIGPYPFLGKVVWTNGPESSSKVSPYTGIGPWMAFPCSKNTTTIEKIVNYYASHSGNQGWLA